MDKKTKLINNIDNDIYNDFVSVCKKKGIKIADNLNELMKEAGFKKNRGAWRLNLRDVTG